MMPNYLFSEYATSWITCWLGLTLFLKKMGQPRPLLSFIFSLFNQTSLQILQQINVKKCPGCRDSNPKPSEPESPPITTRPGLPPLTDFFY